MKVPKCVVTRKTVTKDEWRDELYAAAMVYGKASLLEWLRRDPMKAMG